MAMKYVPALGAHDLLQHCLCVFEQDLHLPVASQGKPSKVEGLMLGWITTAIWR